MAYTLAIRFGRDKHLCSRFPSFLSGRLHRSYSIPSCLNTTLLFRLSSFLVSLSIPPSHLFFFILPPARGAFHFRNPTQLTSKAGNSKEILGKFGNQEITKILNSCRCSICSNLLRHLGNITVTKNGKVIKLRQAPYQLKCYGRNKLKVLNCKTVTK